MHARAFGPIISGTPVRERIAILRTLITAVVLLAVIAGAVFWFQGREDRRLRSDLKKAFVEIDDHSQKIEETSRGIAAEKAVNRQQQTDLEQLRVRFTEVEARVATAEANLTAVKGDVAEASAKLGELEQLRDELQQLRRKLNDGLSQREALRDRVEQLEADRRNNDDRLRRLEERLDLIPAP